ncbi:type II secretion system protein GspL [Piscinibacter koreensis]|uniref:General secretion pathway protein GspL n=1 Tax=Piscinibacter koreensis TaxID=2742824 RepID=A0A7Y6NM45_9BURK|nr:type II secretion system protein GspL [Schlegelella koreensis]NUZ05617.1 general secretion pathway protein GspL [Schlegelella koreensis]
MSTLIVRIPPRQRVRARLPANSVDELERPAEYLYVTSPDGVSVGAHGTGRAGELPKATTVVAVLSEGDVSWHRITLPKAPAARLRAALVGLLEEDLLDDPDAVHLALQPAPAVGQPTWVAALDRDWLQREIARLQDAGVLVDRAVPMAWPDEPPTGYFDVPEGADTPAGDATLTWSNADGVATVRLQGGLARALVPQPVPEGTRWGAAPAAVEAAEQWLGAPVPVLPIESRLVGAARSRWNLLQFDLARKTRGVRALRSAFGEFLSARWRPVRVGLAALVVLQLVGLNAWAWHQRNAVESRRSALRTLVKTTFPRVSEQDVQRDAAAVMQREVQSLRTLAGRPGDADLEPMLQAAAAAWPAARPPVESVRFEPGKLTLAAQGWTEAEIEQFRSLLRAGGWRVDAAEGRLSLTRARTDIPA